MAAIFVVAAADFETEFDDDKLAVRLNDNVFERVRLIDILFVTDSDGDTLVCNNRFCGINNGWNGDWCGDGDGINNGRWVVRLHTCSECIDITSTHVCFVSHIQVDVDIIFFPGFDVLFIIV